jgi:hypothetical protein
MRVHCVILSKAGIRSGHRIVKWFMQALQLAKVDQFQSDARGKLDRYRLLTQCSSEFTSS